METILIILFILLAALWIVSAHRKEVSRSTSELRKELQELVQSLAMDSKNEEKARIMIAAKSDAIIQALSRIDCFEELRWLNTHYEAIKQLLYLRASGVPEEIIVKKYMNYNESNLRAEKRGWKVPWNNSNTGKREILKYSPYYLATNKVQIKELKRLQGEAASKQDPLTTIFGWMPEQEPPGTEERDVPVFYENENGDIVEYPSGKTTKKEY